MDLKKIALFATPAGDRENRDGGPFDVLQYPERYIGAIT
jgi:hypothetical protein